MENLFRARINAGFFRFLIKRNTRLMILTTVAMVALYPLLAFTEFVFNGTYSQGFFNVGRSFQLVVFFVSLVIVPFVIFSYLNSKKSLDVYHALPITRKDLFLTGLAAAVVVVLIPFLLVYGIGWIYNIMVVPGVDNSRIFENLYYSLALAMAITLPFMFSMMNTGTSVDGFLYGLIIHLIPMIAYGTYLVFGNTVLLGFRAPTNNTFLLFTAPLWSIFELNLNRNLVYPNPDLVALYWFVMSFGMAWLVLYFYKIRRSEKAETPFTNNKFYPIIVSMFILIIQFFFYSTFTLLTEGRTLDFRTLIFPVFFTFVGYMILDVIANRGFKNFIKALVKFAILTGVSLAVFVGATLTGGAGYTSFVPNPNNVEKVEFLINDELGLFSPPYTSYIFNETQGIIAYENQTEIEGIVAFHRSIVDRFKELGVTSNNYFFNEETNITTTYPFKLTSYVTSNVQFKYTMKNGSTTLRSYTIPVAWTDTVLPLSTSKPNILNRYPHLSQSDKVNTLSFAPVSFNQKFPLQKTLTKTLFDTYLEEYARLGSKVLAGDNLVGYILSDIEIQGDFGRTSSQALPVFASFTNTLALLNVPEIVISDSLTFEVIRPSSSNNPVDFYVQSFDSSIRYWSGDGGKEYATFTITGSQMQLLLPYITAHHVNDDLVALVKVNPTVGLGVERNSNYVFYSLLEAGRSVLNEILADQVPVFKTIEALYYN
jgi:hypothetical protein